VFSRRNLTPFVGGVSANLTDRSGKSFAEMGRSQAARLRIPFCGEILRELYVSSLVV